MKTKIIDRINSILDLSSASSKSEAAIRRFECDVGSYLIQCIEDDEYPIPMSDEWKQILMENTPRILTLPKNSNTFFMLLSRLWIRVKRLFKKEIQSEDLALTLTEFYEMDIEFLEYIASKVNYIDGAFNGISPDSYPEHNSDWAQNKINFTQRCILLGLAQKWDEDNTDQHELWQAGELLAKVANDGSPTTIAEVLHYLTICCQQELLDGSVDTLCRFIKEANEDKNGNVLDTLYKAHKQYEKLIDEGWEPEKWEIDNMAMSLDILLKFFMDNDFKLMYEIGEKLDIDVNQATDQFRYSGTPFVSDHEFKHVKVLAPGWNHNDQVLVRAKVREIKGGK